MSEVKTNNELVRQLGFTTKVRPDIDIAKPTARVIAAIYIRVSDPRQADSVKGSLKDQIDVCMKAIERNGWEFNGKIYKDEFKGHRIENREGLMQMLEDAAKGFFNVLVVLDGDRFSRNKRTAAVTRSRLADDHFIQVYEVYQPREIVDPALYDPNEDDAGVIHDAIVDIKSDLEIKRLRKKVRQGARTRALRGEPHDVPYGYSKDYKQTQPTVIFDILEIDNEVSVVRRIFNYYVREDYSLRRICSVLNKEKIPAPMGGIWRPPSIRKILGNPFYIGFVRHNHRPVFRGKRKQTPPEEWILKYNPNIPKIIDDDTFKAAQERMKQRYVFRGRAIASEGLLIPLAYCHCGHRLHYKRQNPTPSTLRRSPNASPRLNYSCPCNQIGGVKVCPCNTYKMSASKLEGMVIQRLHELAQRAEAKEVFETLTIDKFKENLKHQISAKKLDILKFSTAKDRWIHAFDEGEMPISPQTYFEHLNELELKLKLTEEELARLELASKTIEQNSSLLEKKREFLMKFDEYFNNGDLTKKKKALQQFIKRVIVGDGGEVHIEFIVDDVLDGVVLNNNVHPHPCGYFGDETRVCTCSAGQVLKYQKKLSGPLLDRIDIHIDVPAVKVEKLVEDQEDAEKSDVVRKRVEKALLKQRKRFEKKKIIMNSEMSSRDLKEFLIIDVDAKNIMREAMKTFALSARSFNKVLKISRTIADLENSKNVESRHVLEALQYRPKTVE